MCSVSEERRRLQSVCVFYEVFPGSVLQVHRESVYFSSSSPSLRLLMEAEAPLGEVGGEGRALYQRAGGDGGDGERRGDSSRGLLQGDPLGDEA